MHGGHFDLRQILCVASQ